MDKTRPSTLWEWVESDEPLDSPEQAVKFFCLLQAEASQQHRNGTAADCFCDERSSIRMDDPPLGGERKRSAKELDHEYWRNDGDVLRWMARTLRDHLSKEGQ